MLDVVVGRMGRGRPRKSRNEVVGGDLRVLNIVRPEYIMWPE